MNATIRQQLRECELFANLSDDKMSCLEPGEVVELEAGLVLTRAGDKVTSFSVLLEGELRVSRDYDNQAILMGIIKPGMYLGEVPLLLDDHIVATVRTLKPCRVFQLKRDDFWRMLSLCPSVASQIFRTMATRVRNMEGYSQQREKLASLGTMAAGLAHELNNPATAARRASAHLREVVENVQSFACELHQQLKPDQWPLLIAASGQVLERAAAAGPIDSITRSDREDEIATWLDNHRVTDGWKLAPALVNAGLTGADLDALSVKLPAQALTPAFGWLEARLSLQSLLKEIDGSTGRIAELVKAVKSYSFLDRSPMQQIDVHEGIESTLTMLVHKLKNITVTRKFDRAIPPIMAYGSELNQVWTNLIDNAIDAVHKSGKICIATFLDHDQVVVEIADNGSGIPKEVQAHMFEPFYTTKGVGSGTGLGLMISNRIVADRHGGEIEFESEPGDTRFKVRLPIQQSTAPNS